MNCEFCDHEMMTVAEEFIEMTYCPNKSCSVNNDGLFYVNVLVRPRKPPHKIIITSTPSGECELYKEYRKTLI